MGRKTPQEDNNCQLLKILSSIFSLTHSGKTEGIPSTSLVEIIETKLNSSLSPDIHMFRDPFKSFSKVPLTTCTTHLQYYRVSSHPGPVPDRVKVAQREEFDGS